MSDLAAHADFLDAIDRFADSLLDEWDVFAPPVDVLTIGEHRYDIRLNVATGPVKRSPRGDPRQVALPPHAGSRDKQWAVAHALGRMLKPAFVERLDVDPDERRGMSGESIANLIAERLLVPTSWLRDAGRAADWDLLALAKTFSTAPEDVIAERMIDLDGRVIVTVIDNEFVTRRRSRGVRCGRELSEIEQQCLDKVHRYSRPYALSGDGRSVRGWPFHREDHKREILRTVVDEGMD